MAEQAYTESSKNSSVTDGLARILADTFVLYFKTHSSHWNVVGPHFRSLHKLFEEQYTELWEALDELAERIRMQDAYAPDSIREIQEKASLGETGQTPDAEGMLDALARDNRTLVDNIYKVVRDAEEAGDQGTLDMLVERIKAHEKAAWMLESTLKH